MAEQERASVLVRGARDVGSAVAAVLFRAGYLVALHDEPAPATPRRGMAFADAVFDGMARLDRHCRPLVLLSVICENDRGQSWYVGGRAGYVREPR
jgi:hypothetical protein